MPYVVHITPFSSHWAKLLTLWDFTHSETARPYCKFVEFFLNKLPVLQLLKPHLSFYHFWWKFTNLLQKRALEGSQIQLFAFFFSRMTPVAPQLTEFGYLQKHLMSENWAMEDNLHSFSSAGSTSFILYEVKWLKQNYVSAKPDPAQYCMNLFNNSLGYKSFLHSPQYKICYLFSRHRHRCHATGVMTSLLLRLTIAPLHTWATVLKWQCSSDSDWMTVLKGQWPNDTAQATAVQQCTWTLPDNFTRLPNLSHSHFNNPNRNVYMEMCILHDFYIWYESTTLASFELESFTRSAIASTCCCLCCSWLQEHIMPHEIEPVPSFPCALPLLCHR